MRGMIRAGCAAVALTGLSCSPAATQGRAATPATLPQTLKQARGGQTITLAPGDYGELTFNQRNFQPAIRIVAKGARFSRLSFRDSDGISVEGGTVNADRTGAGTVVIGQSRNIAIRDMLLTGGRVGVSITRSEGVAIERSRIERVQSDGIIIAGSRRLRIIGNSCRDFEPVLAVYDPQGRLVKDGDHPDCIQAWSEVGRPPVSDVEVIGNTAEGFMQGVFFGNASNGGFDRIQVRNNRLTLSMWNGIFLDEARDSVVQGNVVSTLPGARAPNFPFKQIVTWIRVTGSNNQVCGNLVAHPRLNAGSERC